MASLSPQNWVASAVAAAGLAFLIDFSAWKSNGTGGTPPTLQGYIKIRRWGLYLLFHPRNLLDASEIPDSGPSYLTSSLPPRSGSRPKLTRWTLPQRQHREPITAKASEVLMTLMQAFANSPTWSSYIETRPSKTEGGTGPAIYVKPDVPTMNPNASKIFYEVAHVHPSENSLHVYLSPKDARTVVESGWGEKFTVPWIAPPSWVMVYAPRDEEEVEVVRGIVRAAVCFAVGKDVKKDGSPE
ncbi:hypothetical protein BDV96DRAFT_603722 [Lophiotrema nucula]|uniref:Luciferase domain-containing protein n=1 Tax=Lophiotrema nucula TaxID=690887 RepID=A0A6A5YX21_9PLEO|nr:hypothetical protein BDV96DRAFT_603722 [Lophiotrema nucula]